MKLLRNTGTERVIDLSAMACAGKSAGRRDVFAVAVCLMEILGELGKLEARPRLLPGEAVDLGLPGVTRIAAQEIASRVVGSRSGVRLGSKRKSSFGAR